MDKQKQYYMFSRQFFGYIDNKHIGQKNLINHYFGGIRTSFKEPITKEYIKMNNKIGHWLNQNFIIRLHALLDSYNIKNRNLNNSLEGYNYVKLLINLRNIFVHEGGEYKPNKRKHRKIMKELKLFINSTDENYTEFPIPIDKVTLPLFEGCKKYIEIYFKAQNK